MIKTTLRNLKKSIKFSEQSIFEKSVIDPNMFDWTDISKCLNDSIFRFEIIINGNKMPIPEMRYFWYSTPVQQKRFIWEKINEGSTFVILEYRNEKVNNLLFEIEKIFDVICDAHVYGGLSDTSKSFKPHIDIPSNFIFQIEGTTDWIIYKNTCSDMFSQEEINSCIDKSNLEIDYEIKLFPGDMLYIPPRRFHQALPSGKRLSLSVPCRSKKYNIELQNLDRNYYAIS